MLPEHIRYSDHVEPVDIFSLFLGKALLLTMAENTNTCEAKQLEESSRVGAGSGKR